MKQGDFFGICGFASIDWINCELSTQYLGAGAPAGCTARAVAAHPSPGICVRLPCDACRLRPLRMRAAYLAQGGRP
jgi:hypothetical protein